MNRSDGLTVTAAGPAELSDVGVSIPLFADFLAGHHPALPLCAGDAAFRAQRLGNEGTNVRIRLKLPDGIMTHHAGSWLAAKATEFLSALRLVASSQCVLGFYRVNVYAIRTSQ